MLVLYNRLFASSHLFKWFFRLSSSCPACLSFEYHNFNNRLRKLLFSVSQAFGNTSCASNGLYRFFENIYSIEDRAFSSKVFTFSKADIAPSYQQQLCLDSSIPFHSLLFVRVRGSFCVSIMPNSSKSSLSKRLHSTHITWVSVESPSGCVFSPLFMQSS